MEHVYHDCRYILQLQYHTLLTCHVTWSCHMIRPSAIAGYMRISNLNKDTYSWDSSAWRHFSDGKLALNVCVHLKTKCLTLYIYSDLRYRPLFVGQRASKAPIWGISMPVWKTWTWDLLHPHTAGSTQCVWPQIQCTWKSSPGFPMLSHAHFRMTTKVTINWCCVTHNNRPESWMRPK